MGNVKALLGVVLALAAGPLVADGPAGRLGWLAGHWLSRAAPRPLRPGAPVRRGGRAGGTAARAPGLPCRRAASARNPAPAARPSSRCQIGKAWSRERGGKEG